ncbi:hypothetical protein [Prosthecobacter dejongeii]|uniref:Uncharacterized protein n=1 Tax=Prosthecobacter dejongeii TaxID=48465 RepID=A0A7W7YMI0_9BACT|nr:hypothetical protein [Prosthecobacter dejongeii]MBB5038804.1 hypothetical protein [Prosthecobacter dejongeii]
MPDDLQETLRRTVGDSPSSLPPLKRLEMLWKNALRLRGGVWRTPGSDGTLIRKTVGAPR